MVIVTHKPSVLPLVTRIIVIAGNSIVLDGPRDVVLQQLQQSNAQQQSAAQAAQAAGRPETEAFST
jgi:ATP-binding cassette subfamily C protein LapB